MDGARSASFTQVSVPDGYERFMLRQLFEPWAAELIARADVRPGSHVLDVATGLGPVAGLAAAAAGPGGRVVACDISAAMLAAAATAATPSDAGWAPVEYLECPASAIPVAAASFDAVLCQQGLQFFPDRAAAMREMGRVAKPGAAVVVSTWAAGHPLGLFGAINETLREAAVAEPFPRAFDSVSYQLGDAELADLFRAAGLRDVAVETIALDAAWPTAEEATATVVGTPFGPLVAAMPDDAQRRLRERLAVRLGASPAADGVTVRTVSNIARGVRPR
jgi:ubiquinone/menaquinone biosynthesis C-methylase UbiE